MYENDIDTLNTHGNMMRWLNHATIVSVFKTLYHIEFRC